MNLIPSFKYLFPKHLLHGKEIEITENYLVAESELSKCVMTVVTTLK